MFRIKKRDYLKHLQLVVKPLEKEKEKKKKKFFQK
jgi:hypothetical protein